MLKKKTKQKYLKTLIGVFVFESVRKRHTPKLFQRFNPKLTFTSVVQLGSGAEQRNADNVDRMWFSSKEEA